MSVGANSSVEANLSPYNTMPGQGGQIAVAATVPAAGAGEITAKLQVGTEVPAAKILLPVEKLAGAGPDSETPTFSAVGAPSDPNILEFTNKSAGAIIVSFDVAIIF